MKHRIRQQGNVHDNGIEQLDQPTFRSNTQSIRDRLKMLSIDKKADYRDIESSFLLERMASRIVSSESLRRCLIFKGGFVSLRVYDSDRYTVDLDALLVGHPKIQTMDAIRSQIESNAKDGVWFKHLSNQDLQTLGNMAESGSTSSQELALNPGTFLNQKTPPRYWDRRPHYSVTTIDEDSYAHRRTQSFLASIPC